MASEVTTNVTKLNVVVRQNAAGDWSARIDEPSRTEEGVANHGYYVCTHGCTRRRPRHYPTREAARGAIREYNGLNSIYRLVGSLH